MYVYFCFEFLLAHQAIIAIATHTSRATVRNVNVLLQRVASEQDIRSTTDLSWYV